MPWKQAKAAGLRKLITTLKQKKPLKKQGPDKNPGRGPPPPEGLHLRRPAGRPRRRAARGAPQPGPSRLAAPRRRKGTPKRRRLAPGAARPLTFGVVMCSMAAPPASPGLTSARPRGPASAPPFARGQRPTPSQTSRESCGAEPQPPSWVRAGRRRGSGLPGVSRPPALPFPPGAGVHGARRGGDTSGEKPVFFLNA